MKQLKHLESFEEYMNDNFWKWFQGSIVVDKNGDPLKVYHGTTKDFQEFSYKFARTNGSGSGVGFYFTDDESLANGFSYNSETKKEDGNVLGVYLSIKKPLSLKKITISPSKYAKIIKMIDPDGSGFLSNYGDVDYDGYNGVLNMAVDAMKYCMDDVELITSMINSGVEITKLYNVLKDVTGHDGVVLHNPESEFRVFVAFHPEQVKSATKNNGAFSLKSANIYERNEYITEKKVVTPHSISEFIKGDSVMADEAKEIIKWYSSKWSDNDDDGELDRQYNKKLKEFGKKYGVLMNLIDLSELTKFKVCKYSNSVRTVPENFLVAKISGETLDFTGNDSAVHGRIDKDKILKMWKKGLIK